MQLICALCLENFSLWLSDSFQDCESDVFLRDLGLPSFFNKKKVGFCVWGCGCYQRGLRFMMIATT